MKAFMQSKFIIEKKFLLLIPVFLYLSNLAILSLSETKLRPMEVLTPFLILLFLFTCRKVTLKPALFVMLIMPIGGLFNAVDIESTITSYLLYAEEISFLYIFCANTKNIPNKTKKEIVDITFKFYYIAIVYAVIQFLLANIFDSMILYNNLGIFQWHPHYENTLRGIIRATSVFYEPSVLGWVCVFMFALNEYLRIKRYLMPTRVLTVIGTLVSFSSSGILGMGLLIALTVFMEYRKKRVFKLILIVGAIFLVVAGPFLFNLLRLPSILVEGTSGYKRIAYPFLAMIDTLTVYPIFGRGLGQIALADPLIAHYEHIHNSFFGIIVTFGLSGLFIYLQLGKLFVRWWNKDRRTIIFPVLVLFLLFVNGSFLTLEYPIVILIAHLAIDLKTQKIEQRNQKKRKHAKKKASTEGDTTVEKNDIKSNIGGFKNNLPLISVIVPVYNVEKYLRRCVESIVTQSYQNLEIILVDDGSTDGSPSICDEYAQTDPRVRVFHKENGGSGSARNIALDNCSGEYIGFVDSDDWIEPDMYLDLYRVCREARASIAVGGRYDVDAETMQVSQGLCPQHREIINGEELLYRAMAWMNIDFSGCDKLFRAELWTCIRFPVGKKCEDIAALYKIYYSAGEVVLLNKPVYYYFHRSNSNSTAKLSDRSFDYPQVAEEIKDFVQKKCPKCTDAANVLRIKSIAFVLADIMKADANARAHYQNQYNTLLAELRESKSFWSKNAIFSKLDRTQFTLLLYPRVYRLVRKFRQLVLRVIHTR